MSSQIASYSATKMSNLLQKELEQYGDYNSIDTLRRKERQEMMINKSLPSTPYQRVFPSYENDSRTAKDFIKVVDSTPVQKQNDQEVELYKKEILELRSRILELEDRFKGMDVTQTPRPHTSKAIHYKSSSVYNNPSHRAGDEQDVYVEGRQMFSSTKSSLKTKKRGISALKSKKYKYSSDSEESTSDSDGLELEIAKYKRMTKENTEQEKKKSAQKHVKERKKLKLEIKELNREYDDDKAHLIKERVKGQDLAERIRKTNRELEKMELKLIKASKIEGDFKRLLDSYNKSEFIRDQQTALIRHLSSQVKSSKTNTVQISKKSTRK